MSSNQTFRLTEILSEERVLGVKDDEFRNTLRERKSHPPWTLNVDWLSYTVSLSYTKGTNTTKYSESELVRVAEEGR